MRLLKRIVGFWHKNIWTKIGMIILVLLLVTISLMYGIAKWYQTSQADQPLRWGTTFIPSYAESFGVDPEETMDAIIEDLGIKRFRLVSYWDEIEQEPGVYDFRRLDWQFKKVEDAGGEVVLALGLRQPRWPECHMPNWAKKVSKVEWQDKLNRFIAKVVMRYRDSPALKGYQLENEFHLEVFGECPDHSRDRLIREASLVKTLDPKTPLTMTRSNNAVPSWPMGKPKSDINGAAIYKFVWDRTITKRYFTFPYPAWYYSFLAGGAKLTTGNNTFIHELQAEPWIPDGMYIKTATLEEQYKSMNPKRLAHMMDFAEATGMRTIDLWGAEWWYWQKTVHNNPALWDIVKERVSR